MNKQEYQKALNIAKNDLLDDYQDNDLDSLDGFALRDFQPVCCTLSTIARLIKWQAQYFNGQYDNDALNEIWACRRKFIVVDDSE